MNERPLNSVRHPHLIATIIVLAAITVTLAVILYNAYKPPVIIAPVPLTLTPTTVKQLEQIKPVEVAAPLPVRLKIPKINVDAAIEYVSLTPAGAMGVPDGPTTVAWFQDGPRPGDKGSAVIDGHFGIWKGGIPTVFNDLYKLRKGDEILVEDEKGVAITFVVSELRIYDDNQDALDVFTSNDNKSHLNLITCEGIWSRSLQRFPSRLVVFTDKLVE